MNKSAIISLSSLLAIVVTSSCQKEGLELTYEQHQGESVVVEASESVLPATSDVFQRLAAQCESIDMGRELETLKGQMSALSGMKLSQKMQARLHLMDNFVNDVEAAEDCTAVKRVSQNYQSLNKVFELNSHHELNYYVHNHPLIKKEVEKVESRFGALYISRDSVEKRFESNVKPWTGYWYPASAIGMLTGSNSPLEKFDKVLSGLRRATGVLKEERRFFGGLENVDTWEGHCHAWSMAAVVFPEPQRATQVGGVRFSIADMKAILTKAAAYTEAAEYGIRYKGDAETDGTYQDIVPEAFHKLLSYHLSNNIAVVIDDDAGPEVWTKPVVSMISRMRPASGIENAVEVKSYLKLVRQRDSAKEANTTTDFSAHTGSLVLSYRLYHEASPSANGKYRVIRGEWIGDSAQSHPDIVIIPNVDKPASDNSVLNRNLDVVDRLLDRTR